MSKKQDAQTVVIQARVNPKLRDNTDIIFERMGISRSQAIKIFLNHVEMHRGLPFAMKLPNDEVVQSKNDHSNKSNTINNSEK